MHDTRYKYGEISWKIIRALYEGTYEGDMNTAPLGYYGNAHIIGNGNVMWPMRTNDGTVDRWYATWASPPREFRFEYTCDETHYPGDTRKRHGYYDAEGFHNWVWGDLSESEIRTITNIEMLPPVKAD